MKHTPESKCTIPEIEFKLLDKNLIGLDHFQRHYPSSQVVPKQREYFQVFKIDGGKVIVDENEIWKYLKNIEYVKGVNKSPEGCLLSIIKGLLGIYYFEEKMTKDSQSIKHEELLKQASGSAKVLEAALQALSAKNKEFVEMLPDNVIKEAINEYGLFSAELITGANGAKYAFFRHEVIGEYREYRHRDGVIEYPNSSLRYFVTQSGELFRIFKQNYSYKSNRSTVLSAGTPDVLAFVKQNITYFDGLVASAKQNRSVRVSHSKEKPYDLHISRVDIGVAGQLMNETQHKNVKAFKAELLDSQNVALLVASQIAREELRKMKFGTPDSVLLNKSK